MQGSPQAPVSGQKLSKEESRALHRGTGLLAMSWHLRKVLSPSKVLLTPHTLLTSPPFQSFALCAPLPLPVAGLGLRALFFSLLLSSSSQHHSTFLLPSISCQSSCAPVCTPTASLHLSPFIPCGPNSQVWQKKLGFSEDQHCQRPVTSLGRGNVEFCQRKHGSSPF